MDSKINQILQEFTTQSPSIKGILLVTSQGQPMTVSLGIAQDSSLIIAGMMLYIAQRVREECDWSDIKRISVQAQEGYLTLISCDEEIFLLIQTTNAPSGLLDKNINEVVKQLKLVFNGDDFNQSNFSQNNGQIQELYTEQQTVIKELDPNFIYRCQQELAQFIGPIAPLICQRILNQNHGILTREYVEKLAKQIPDSQQALEFQQRLLDIS